MILSDGGVLQVPAGTFGEDSATPAEETRAIADENRISGHERELIEEALARSKGRVSGASGAAAQLGVAASTLESKIKRLGVDKYKFFQTNGR